MFEIELVDGTRFKTDTFSPSDSVQIIQDDLNGISDIESVLTKDNLKVIKYLDGDGFLIRSETNKEYNGKMLRERYKENQWLITFYLDTVDVIKEEIEKLKNQVADLMAKQEQEV